MKTTNALAIAIADGTARSDIELFAGSTTVEGVEYHNTAMTAPGCGPDELEAVQRAVQYIDQRGDVFPWYMQRHIGASQLVRFVEKESNDG